MLGLAIYGFLEWTVNLSVWQLLTAVLVPVFLFSLLFARHSKALFLALDLFFDPHEKEDGNDGGNVPVKPKPPGGEGPAQTPGGSCDRAKVVR